MNRSITIKQLAVVAAVLLVVAAGGYFLFAKDRTPQTQMVLRWPAGCGTLDKNLFEIRDQADDIVFTTALGRGSDDGMGCRWDFKAKLPDRPVYQVNVLADRYGTRARITKEQLEDNGHRIELDLPNG